MSEEFIVGKITPEMAKKLPFNRTGVIIVNKQGLEKIEKEHTEYKKFGFSGALGFIRFILENICAIYQGNSQRTFALVSRKANSNSQAIVRLEFEKDGDKYLVKTAHPIRKDFYRNVLPLWERAQTNRLNPAD